MTPEWHPLTVRGGSFNPEIKRRTERASGAYAIRRKDTHRVVYVGEAHRGGMWKTLLRHFHAADTFATIGRNSFAVNDPTSYEIALWVTSTGKRPRKDETPADQKAMTAQATWIRTLRPLHNKDDGMTEDERSGEAYRAAARAAEAEEEERGAFDDLLASNPPIGYGLERLTLLEDSIPKSPRGIERKGNVVTLGRTGSVSLSEPLAAWFQRAARAVVTPVHSSGGQPEARRTLTIARAVPALPAKSAARPWYESKLFGPDDVRIEDADGYELGGANTARATSRHAARVLVMLATFADLGAMLRRLGVSAGTPYEEARRALVDDAADLGRKLERRERARNATRAELMQLGHLEKVNAWALDLLDEEHGRGARAPAPVVRPEGYGDEDAKRRGQLRMFNPRGTLHELGILTGLGYVDARGSRKVLAWTLRDAPVLAYDDAGRLFIVYAGAVVRASTEKERKEYRRTHWGRDGRGDARGGGLAVGPFRKLGRGTFIQYTTRKGSDRALVDYVHEWGEGSRRTCVPPTIVVHRCGAKGCKVENAIGLEGGSYTVEARGIVG